MKKLLKTTLLLAMTLAMILPCTTNVSAARNTTLNADKLARAVLYGQNFGYLVINVHETGDPVIVGINPDNPDEVFAVGHELMTASKDEFINYLVEYTDEDIAKVKSYCSHDGINEGTSFDEPTNRSCTKCPGRALERAKGTFYQDYVYDYWKQYNEIYASDTGYNIPSVEAFFAAEGATLNTVTPTVTPTPVPTTPPKAVEKINEIKGETDVENTLLVIDTDGVLTLAVNGEIVEFPDLQPFIDTSGRTQIPVRALAEMLNCDVNWDDRINTAIISSDAKLITIAINSNILTVNGVDTTMDTTAMLKDERTCVPVRYIAEALGLTVRYETV